MLKKLVIVLALAVLMLAFIPALEGKSQNANIKNEIKSGHHNTIVTNVDQLSGIANKNNIPYGQVKKIASGNLGSSASGADYSQAMDIQNQILGGHHNVIVVNGRQVAVLGGTQTSDDNSTISETNSTSSGNLSQALNIQNQISGGHHNLIWVSSTQIAEMSASGSGNLTQSANLNNLIAGGHHNVILLGSNQIAQMNSLAY